MTPLQVDCYDVHWKRPVVECVEGDRHWHFVFDPALKAGRAFTYALFFNETALTRSVYRYPRSRRIAALRETPVRAVYKRHAELARRFDRIYTFEVDLIRRGAPFIEHFNAVNWLSGWGQSGEVVEKTRNVSFMGSIEHADQDGYSLRKQVAAYLLSQPGVDCPSIGRVLDPRGVLSFETLDDLKALLPQLTEARYEQMREFVESNKRQLLANGMATTDGYLGRLARSLHSAPGMPVNVFHRSRVAAAWRALTS